MNLVTNGILMVAAASFTLGAIHVSLSFQRRSGLTHLLFVVAAFGVAGYALFERALMMTDSPVEYGDLLRWAHACVWLVLIPLALFVRAYLKTGRDWLLWPFLISRTIALVLNFTTGVNLNYIEISSIRRVSFLGEIVSIPVATPNKWMIVGQIGLLLAMIYFIDAAIGIWRRGDHRRALTIGVSVAVFSVASFFVAILVLWGIIAWPLAASPFFLGMIAAMGYELTWDVRRVGELAHELTESKAELGERARQLDLSAGAANVGLWTRVIGEERILATEKWHELFEFEISEKISFRDYLRRIHPEDRGRIEASLVAAETGRMEYETEYRILLRNGEIRWISSKGRIDDEGGNVVRLRGASVDITKRKIAEEDAHGLSRKLMGAQEKERARIARELHDDLSQNLALLSINLQSVSRDAGKPDDVKRHIDKLTSHIQRLSSDLHRISHELHPAKLGQLGLESALRGFCREISTAHGVKVEFEAANVARSLPDDISLCLYRVTQESLQNIVKHSGASIVNVNIEANEDEILLTVTDNGSGFEPEADKSKESLGLISMSERLRAVNGAVKIRSTIGAGTQITARVPQVVPE